MVSEQTSSSESTLISIQNVEKSFASQGGIDHMAVREFNLDICHGEFFCLLGPSGCGKTTVLNMAAGFEQPTSGAIQLHDKPIKGPGSDRGVVFQGDDSLFPWLTASQNVEFGLRMRGLPKVERNNAVDHYLDLVGLGNQGDKYPSELSGGMRQRIQIARVLANEPEMLLMDEPFGALDAQTRTIMQEHLARIWRSTKTSVLFITHDIEEAVILGTRIGVMHAGPASTLKGVVEVNLPAERHRTDDSFMTYYREIHDMIREEVLATVNAGTDRGMG